MSQAGIWVFVEVKNSKLQKVTREALSEGRRLADSSGVALTAVVFGQGTDALTDDIGRQGADEILVVEHVSLEKYETLPYCGVLADLIRKGNPIALLFGASNVTHDLAPRLAARLKTGLVTNCTNLEMTGDGTLELTRGAYGGQIAAHFRFTENRQQLATISPGAVEIVEKRKIPQLEKYIPQKLEEPEVEALDIIKAEPGSVGIEDAEIVVSGGRGLGGKDEFRKLEELAMMLRASTGGTRVAVDNGWIPFERQIGQTGKIISPGLLITMGTSGAIQYTMGFKDAEFVVAVDNNPRAPIFQVADAGIVADANQIVTAMLRLIRDYSIQV